MSTDSVTNAQVPTTAADNSQAATPVPAQQPVPVANPYEGIQKRIDELTAKSYEKDGTIQALMQQVQSLSLQQTQRAYEPTPQPAQVDLSQLDPAVAKAFEAYSQQQQAQYQRQMSAVLTQSAQTQLQALTAKEDPRVAQRTQQIWADAVSKNAHLSGFTPEQALFYARGQLWETLTASQQAQVQSQAAQNFNRAAQTQVLPAQSGPQSTPGVPQVQGQAPDPEDDPEGSAAFYSQRLGNKAF